MNRTGQYSALTALFVAVLQLSCGLPYLERARDPQGWSVMAGIEGDAAGSLPSLTGDTGGKEEWSFGPFGSVRKTFCEHFSGGLCGMYRFGYTRDDATKHVSMTPGAEALLTGKLLLGQTSAIKLDAGGTWSPGDFGPLGEIGFLQDLGEAFTLSVSAGWPYVLGIGINFHPPASQHFTPHVAGCLQALGVGWGLGAEWHQEKDPNSVSPPGPHDAGTTGTELGR